MLFLVLNVLVHWLGVEMCKSKVYKAKTVNEEEDNSMNFVNPPRHCEVDGSRPDGSALRPRRLLSVPHAPAAEQGEEARRSADPLAASAARLHEGEAGICPPSSPLSPAAPGTPSPYSCSGVRDGAVPPEAAGGVSKEEEAEDVEEEESGPWEAYWPHHQF